MSHSTPSQRETILAHLQQLMAEAMPASSGEMNIHLPFLEMGANSLILMDVQRTVEQKYGITITIPQFFEELTTIDELVNFIDRDLVQRGATAAPVAVAAPIPVVAPQPVALQPTPLIQPAAAPIPMLQPVLPTASVALPLGGAGELETIFAAQMRAATQVIQGVVAQQLQFLQGGSGLSAGAAAVVTAPVTAPAAAALPTPAVAVAPPAAPIPAAPSSAKPKAAMQPNKMLSALEIRARGLTPTQQAHLEGLIDRLTRRTAKSKAQTAEYRRVLADSRASVGFRFTTKEMLYPIVGVRSKGTRVWDLDGNEYIDISMGQGVTFFGHHPDFIDRALREEGEEAIQLGPRPHNTGEAAALIAEMTGFERVTFTNSGTEAVMAALRLARAATGRNKIVMFEGSYHGHADSVMGTSQRGENFAITTKPVSPGTPQGAVEDLWLLEYDSPEALAFIRHHGAEIAAVIVEPVQSRNPRLQPREFLHQLRAVTKEVGALLIFDEMITGFRVHPRGAQAWFGVDADLATYGKLIGGGMPIGVVAGPASIMDRIDGGAWSYGDSSYPVVNRVVFGGTFCQHPLAMTATVAALRYLKEQGPALQERLNRMTADLAGELNRWFQAEAVPIEVVWFGSLFRFEFGTNLDLLFYHLLEKGILIWEWRNYFISTAHTAEDIAAVIAAVKASVLELRAGGFLPPKGGDGGEKKSLTSTPTSYPLSAAQQQLAVLAQIAPQGSMAYHVSPLLKLTGTLHLAPLAEAINGVVARHEALRSRIVAAKQQQILPHTEQPLPLIDLRSEADPAARSREWLLNHAAQPFDLERDPLFNAHLLQLGERDYRLVLKGHHIIVDGLSMNLIVQEIAAYYTALQQGQRLELPPPLQYRDYLAWAESNPFTAQEAYWLEQLKGELPPLELPADRQEPALKSYRGGRISRPIDSALFKAVKQLSTAQGCTHFMTLLSVYALWLHRLSGQAELLVGMPVAGRSLPKGDQLIGYCTHLIPIRSRANWSDPFTTYLRTMRTTLLHGYQNQDYPFARLMEKLPLKRDGRHAPLIGALFNLDRPGVAPTMTGLTVEWLSQPIPYTAFEVIFNLTELGDELMLECDFNADRFDAETVERLVGHFETLLQGVVTTPQQSLATLPLLDEAAWRRIVLDYNRTETPYPDQTTVSQLFEAVAAEQEAAPAIEWDGGSLTYGQLNSAANQLAHHLIGLGLQPEQVAGVYLRRSPQLVIAIWAILKAGGAYLPLDPAYPAERLSFMVQDAATPLLLTEAALADRLTLPTTTQRIELDHATAWAAQPTTNPPQRATADSLAYLIYTSGSTGLPKGTMIIQRGMINYLSWAMGYYRTHEGSGSPLHSSIGFDATLTSLFTPLLSGKKLYLLPEEGVEIDHIRHALTGSSGKGHDWSLVKLTPAHMELINAMIPEPQLAGLTRYLVLGGEALLGRTVAPWRRGAPDTHIINEYGPTETVVGCCIYDERDPHPSAGAVPIGQPIQNTQLYILDAHGQPVPEGVTGELYIGGAGVARGYLNRPELTAERFIELSATGLPSGFAPLPAGRLYRTGDLARWRSDGHILYLGRVDNQIKLRGYRIELGEIEQVLIHQPAVQEAVVVLQRRSEQDQRLIAYLVAAAGQTIDEMALRAALGRQLPDHMIPALFIVLERLPLTTNGKVDRKALPQPTAQSGSVALLSPRSQAEKQIAAIWAELLEREAVGVDQSFFEIGGHSLLVLPLRDRLTATFGREVAPVEIFQYPTVAALARLLTGEGEVAAESAAVGLGGATAAGRKKRNSEQRLRALGG